MKPVTVSEATRFVSLLFRPNKQLFIAPPPCLNQRQKPFKQLIALIIMLASTAFYNPAFAQANVQFPDNPNQSLRSDVIGGQWVPVNNLFNDGSNIIIQPFAPFSGGPIAPFSTDFRLSVFGERIVQVSGSNNIGTAFGDRWNAIGDRLPFTTSPGFSSNGLRSQWDGFSANFGMSDDPSGTNDRHGLIQWQDISVTSLGSTTNSRLRFVFRDGNAPSAGGLATEVGTALFNGKWGFGLNNIAPLSTVDVKGGLYVGSAATVSAGTGNGYFNNSVRIGTDGFMSGASATTGLLVESRIGIGTNNPSTALEIIETGSPLADILIRCSIPSSPPFTNGTQFGVNGTNTQIENLDNGDMTLTNSINGILRLQANGRVMIGNGIANADLTVNGNSANGTGAWINNSDERLKNNISPFKDGLDVLVQMNPIWFEYNGKLNMKSNGLQTGFIAQEIKKIAPYMVITNKDEEFGEYYSINNAPFNPIIINSIKQLKSENDYLNEKLSKQEFELDQIRILLQNNGINIDNNIPKLYQNTPNPFSGETQIGYFLPDNIINAQIVILDSKNEQVAIFNELAKGKSFVTFGSKNALPTTYYYSLIINGEKVATLKMLTK